MTARLLLNDCQRQEQISKFWALSPKFKKDKVPHAIFFMGLPASGKTHVKTKVLPKKLSLNTKNYVDIDSDKIMETIDGYSLEHSGLFHQEGVIIANKILDSVISNYNFNFIYDATGKDWTSYRKNINKAKKNGFKTTLIYVKVDLQTSINRATKRDRKVPENAIRNIATRLNNLATNKKSPKYIKEIREPKERTVFSVLSKLDTLDESFIIEN